jgi:hypothetical protein
VPTTRTVIAVSRAGILAEYPPRTDTSPASATAHHLRAG